MLSPKIVVASRPFFSAQEISSFERTLLLNPNATEHDASEFFSVYPTFLHLGQGGEVRREVAISGSGAAYRVDFFRKSFGRKYSDIVELKSPTYSVVAAEEGNHPRLSAIATSAISQALDYRDSIISSSDIREELALRNIHVLRPSLTVILGKDPEELSPDQFEILLDRVRSQGPIELMTYSALHRFAVEHFRATGVLMLPTYHLSIPNLDTFDVSIDLKIVRLFAGNLASLMEDSELRNSFQEIAQVYDFYWPKDRETGKKKGFAYVDIGANDVEEVIAVQNGRDVMGRKLVVNEVKPRIER
jgi:hypothetical protein